MALLFAAAAGAASGASAQVRVEAAPDAKEQVLASALKDTLRTVTGLVACVNAADRATRVPTATAGIR